MIKRVLVGLDGSRAAERALPDAEAIARASQAGLIVIQAVSPDDPRTLAARRRLADEYLSAVAQRLAGESTTTQIVVADGDPATVFLAQARATGADLIVLARPRAADDDDALGQVLEGVLTLSQTPVLVVPAESADGDQAPRPRASRLAVPLDGSPAAETALPLASELARGLRAEVVLVSVVDVLDPASPSSAAIWELAPQDLPKPDEQVAAGYLDIVIAQLQSEGVQAVRAVRADHPAVGIVDVAVQSEASLIVMATRGHQTDETASISPVVREVLRLTQIPVLLVRVT